MDHFGGGVGHSMSATSKTTASCGQQKTVYCSDLERTKARLAAILSNGRSGTRTQRLFFGKSVVRGPSTTSPSESPPAIAPAQWVSTYTRKSKSSSSAALGSSMMAASTMTSRAASGIFGSNSSNNVITNSKSQHLNGSSVAAYQVTQADLGAAVANNSKLVSPPLIVDDFLHFFRKFFSAALVNGVATPSQPPSAQHFPASSVVHHSHGGSKLVVSPISTPGIHASRPGAAAGSPVQGGTSVTTFDIRFLDRRHSDATDPATASVTVALTLQQIEAMLMMGDPVELMLQYGRCIPSAFWEMWLLADRPKLIVDHAAVGAIASARAVSPLSDGSPRQVGGGTHTHASRQKLAAAASYVTPSVLIRRRILFLLRLQRTIERLRQSSIKLPLNADRLDAERRALLSRDLTKTRFATNIFLRQNPTLDLRRDILDRRQQFQDRIDETVAFVIRWEHHRQSQQQSLSSTLQLQLRTGSPPTSGGGHGTASHVSRRGIGGGGSSPGAAAPLKSKRHQRMLQQHGGGTGGGGGGGMPKFAAPHAKLMGVVTPSTAESGTSGDLGDATPFSASLTANPTAMGHHSHPHHEQMLTRRQSRRASVTLDAAQWLASKGKGSSKGGVGGSLIDVKAILAAPYEGPAVSEAYRNKMLLPPLTASGATMFHSSTSPRKLHHTASPSGVSAGRQDAMMARFLDPLPLVRTASRESAHRGGAPHSSLMSQQHSLSFTLTSLHGGDPAHHRRPTSPGVDPNTAVSPSSKKGGKQKQKLSEPHLAGIHFMAAQPLPRSDAIPATAHDVTREGPSKAIDAVLQQHEQFKEGMRDRSTALSMWLPPPPSKTNSSLNERRLDRTTSSLQHRLLSPQVLTFFDEHGVIDGRAGEEPLAARKDGVVYSSERISDVRDSTAHTERQAVQARKQQQTAQQLLRSGSGQTASSTRHATPDDGPAKSTDRGGGIIPDSKRARSVFIQDSFTGGPKGEKQKQLGESILGASTNSATMMMEKSTTSSGSFATTQPRRTTSPPASGGAPAAVHVPIVLPSEYRGPNHGTSDRGALVPSAERLRELLSTVFVKGGDVGTFVNRMALEARSGLKRPDVRRSHRDRLGGDSLPRSVLQ